jgi:hypothetical protein
LMSCTSKITACHWPEVEAADQFVQSNSLEPDRPSLTDPAAP